MLTGGHEHPVSTGYEAHFGLVESPFSLTPDPRFLFESRSHSEALAHVMSALRRREALVVITGEVGTGKTMLCRTVLERLQRRTFLRASPTRSSPAMIWSSRSCSTSVCCRKEQAESIRRAATI